MIASTIGLSVIAMVAIIVMQVNGVDMSGGVLPAIAILPGVGLPVAFLFIIVFVVVTIIRRSRAAKDAHE
jgi:hypothetical protein